MSRKQLGVAWLTGIIIALIFLVVCSDSYNQALDNVFRAVGYSIPVSIIGGLLIYTMRKTGHGQKKSTTGLLKKLPHDKELLDLLNRQQYAEAMELIIRMGESNTWSEEDTIARGNLCAEAYAVSLYGEAATLARIKDYDKASETSKALSSFVLEHPEFFGLNVTDLSMISAKIHEKMDVKPNLSMPEIQELKEQIIGKFFVEGKDKRVVGNTQMLLDALIMTEFWKSESESNKG